MPEQQINAWSKGNSARQLGGDGAEQPEQQNEDDADSVKPKQVTGGAMKGLVDDSKSERR